MGFTKYVHFCKELFYRKLCKCVKQKYNGLNFSSFKFWNKCSFGA